MTIEIVGITERHELAVDRDHVARAVYDEDAETLTVETIHQAYASSRRVGTRVFEIPPLTEPDDVQRLLEGIAAIMEAEDAEGYDKEYDLAGLVRSFYYRPLSEIVDPVDYAGLATVLGDAVVTAKTTDEEIEALAAQLAAEALEHGDELWDEDALISHITDLRDSLREDEDEEEDA